MTRRTSRTAGFFSGSRPWLLTTAILTAVRVRNPRELGDELRADGDHHAAHHERAEDAPEEDAMLVLRRDGEVAEDHGDDEDVVHREGLLDEVAGEEELGGFEAVDIARGAVELRDVQPAAEPVILIEEVHRAVEEQRDHDPDDRPRRRFLHRDDVRVPVKDAQVERQEQQHEQDEGEPDPDHGGESRAGGIESAAGT